MPAIPKTSMESYEKYKDYSNERFGLIIFGIFFCFFLTIFFLTSIASWTVQGIDSITYCQYLSNGWVAFLKGITHFFSRLI